MLMSGDSLLVVQFCLFIGVLLITVTSFVEALNDGSENDVFAFGYFV